MIEVHLKKLRARDEINHAEEQEIRSLVSQVVEIPADRTAIRHGEPLSQSTLLLEGWMAVQYGEQAADLFKRHYPKIGLGVAAAVLVIYLFNSLLKKRRREATS